MLSFKRFLRQALQEGGNIKIGEVGAEPIKITHRPEQTQEVHNALSELHDSFHTATGHHLFGASKKALSTGSAYSGSTKSLMSKDISDSEFTKHKPTVGDIDVQIPKEHKETLAQHLQPGQKYGRYTVVGTKKHGNEVSAVMRHDDGSHHQFDFEATHYEKEEPTKGEQFLHSSDWQDTKAGIKGAHHKILISSVSETHKFSITHGLRPRTETGKEPGTTDPTEVSKTLFGPNADHSKITSFHGVVDLIKKHVPAERHQAIYDKFKSGVSGKTKIDNGPALAHMRKVLGVKDTVTEETDGETHHVSVVPMVGFSPISHMGHVKDLFKGTLDKLPGKQHIGISAKSDAFSPEERKGILERQLGNKNSSVHVVSGAGETVRKAYDSMPSTGRRVLHMVVGADRASFAEGLKKSLEAGKIKEMEGNKFDEIHIHYPEDKERTHGMSGTNMRAAANSGDEKEFHRHLGPMFSKDESSKIMGKVKSGIDSGKIALKRK